MLTPYEIHSESNETILLDIQFQPSRKSEPFHFAVSDRALYLPALKSLVFGDPRYLKRVKNDQIESVFVEEVPPYGFWIAAALMLLVGLAISGLLLTGSILNAPPSAFGWSLALIAGGALLPLATNGKQRLVVITAKGVFKWAPPMIQDKTSKLQVQTLLQNILDTCNASGKPVLAAPGKTAFTTYHFPHPQIRSRNEARGV